MSLIEILLLLILIAVLYGTWSRNIYLKNLDENLIYYNTADEILSPKAKDKTKITLLKEIADKL